MIIVDEAGDFDESMLNIDIKPMVKKSKGIIFIWSGDKYMEENK